MNCDALHILLQVLIIHGFRVRKFLGCRSKDNIVQNITLGHLLRTKSNLVNEGGVAAGFGALDSPFLY